jgi:hypothetical protein
MNITKEEMSDQINQEVVTFSSVEPEFECPKHGNITQQVLSSSIEGYEMNLCLRCCLEKLQEIGVLKAKRTNQAAQ